ncbi:MAG: site-2 protease family protein [Planctomycetaceae bacterium]|jgi:regulator of sigma E protease|nr:site-2 protease family protein [Planctomycetaceae bacterium]
MDFSIIVWAAANMQPTIFETIINVTIKVLLVIAGINALIIIHEWGHFIAARSCGVRCEKFYIWFDFLNLKFFKFKWGETEYGLGMFPLGGYVKMLGQEDNPGELKAELERAKIQNVQKTQNEDNFQNSDNSQKSAETKQTQIDIDSSNQPEPVQIDKNITSVQKPPRSADELQEAIFAKDSYLAKNVPQRLVIIVAGVVMNFIFAIVCATIAYLVGVIDTAPVIGNVTPGSPAWEAGLQTDDKIKSINGNTVRAFMDVNMAAVGGAEGVDIVIERIVNNEKQELTKKFKPRKRQNDLAPMMGINPCILLNLSKVINYPVELNARKFYQKESLDKLKYGNLYLTKIANTDIINYGSYLNASLEHWGKPVEMTFIKNETESDTITPKNYQDVVKNTKQVTVTIPAIPIREVGLRFKMGEITSVLPDSDAAKKGIKTGDVIVAVDGVDNFDPLKLAYIILKKVNAGQKSVQLKIKRDNNSADNITEKNNDRIIETINVELQPIRIIPQISFLSMQDSLGSTALGLAWDVDSIVDDYLPEASDKAKKIPIGSKIISVKFINSIPMLNTNSFSYAESDGIVFHDVGDRVKLPYIFDNMLQHARTSTDDTDTENNKNNNKKKLSIQFEVIKPDGTNELFQVEIYDSSEYFRADRGLIMSEFKDVVETKSIVEALKLGILKTVEYSLAVYITLKRFYDGTVSPRALGGPVLVVQSAYSFVSRGVGAYLLFLCIISANLAVVNLLPMPPLDGGHVVFLLYEGIFRRPPNILVQAIISWVGLLLIILLGLWVIALDFSFIPRF